MKYHSLRHLSFVLWLLPLCASASFNNLLPPPKSVTPLAGEVIKCDSFSFNNPTLSSLLPYDSQGLPVTTQLVDSIPGAYDYELYGFPNEAYRLKIGPDSVGIEAVTPTGIIRAAQTLRQLSDDGALSPAEIVDWPAFKLRGYMHDIGRDYISVETLLRHIELLSQFKVNTFHWHLTENQAWRLEIKSHPELTADSTMTRLPGKYYTAEDVRRVMEKAKAHGVTVIPEIDMPGHSAAFTRATGRDMQSPEGMAILRDVLREVVAMFAESPYIHIGADERRITNEDFLPSMTSFLHGLGKRVIVWNPIMGVKISKDSGFDMTQMWGTAGKLVPGIPNIDCRYAYTNHFDVFADPVGLYNSSIYYSDRGTPEIAGAIVCTWADRRLPDEKELINQNNFYTNVLVSTERAWIGGGSAYIESGGVMLPPDGPVFEQFADFERRFLYHKERSLRDEPIPYRKQTDIRWLITDTLGNEYMATGAAVYLRHTWGDIIPALFSNVKTDSYAEAVTHVFSPVDQEAGALIEFQNYSRSEVDSAPDEGCWDRKGSTITLNGQEILPPAWKNSGVKIINETLLLNENFAARPPVRVNLKRGWNTVRIALPYRKADGVRLNKWLFTFMLTDTEGKAPLKGIFYSPYLSE